MFIIPFFIRFKKEVIKFFFFMHSKTAPSNYSIVLVNSVNIINLEVKYKEKFALNLR